MARTECGEASAQAIFQKLETGRAEMLLAGNPIALCLEAWLKDTANRGRSVNSAELNAALTPIAARQEMHWPYQNAHALGQRLSHILSNLKECFRTAQNSGAIASGRRLKL
jgi:hypothetical protein